MRECMFCRIRDGRAPAQIVHRDEHCIGFQDIRPKAPAHVLFIPLKHI
ncbi:MAG TPA: HIT domain-containing protein, partial [Myxococcaceae bacterium]|nr:HIT domain-containing protein [Myxococcaceae bacterium]